MLNITKATDEIEITSIISLIYGQPGTGKTSICGTAKDTLLLDFDRGSHRSAFRPDTVRVESWAQVANIQKEDVAGYKTIAVDTAGRALDFLIAGMPATEGKTQLKRNSGEPTLQGYGMLKASFTGWLRRLTTLGLDVIMIAHDREDKDGDTRLIRPDITGGSYGELVKAADFVGYLYKEGKDTILDFSPCAAFIGKNSAGLEALRVPNFAENPDWFAGVMAKMKSAMGGIAERQRDAIKLIEALKERVEEAETGSDYDAIKKSMAEWPRPMKEQGWSILTKAAKKAGFKYDRKADAFCGEDVAA